VNQEVKKVWEHGLPALMVLGFEKADPLFVLALVSCKLDAQE
jgi:hypothetical protein